MAAIQAVLDNNTNLVYTKQHFSTTARKRNDEDRDQRSLARP
jgi:hypothetical protein